MLAVRVIRRILRPIWKFLVRYPVAIIHASHLAMSASMTLTYVNGWPFLSPTEGFLRGVLAGMSAIVRWRREARLGRVPGPEPVRGALRPKDGILSEFFDDDQPSRQHTRYRFERAHRWVFVGLTALAFASYVARSFLCDASL